MRGNGTIFDPLECSSCAQAAIKIIYDGMISYNRVNSFIKLISSGLREHVDTDVIIQGNGWRFNVSIPLSVLYSSTLFFFFF